MFNIEDLEPIWLMPLLIKRKVGVLSGVLRGPRIDALLLACYGSVSL
jgi:hypothetical protein